MAKLMKFTGTVSAASARPWADQKTGDEITLHSFQLAETGNRWFRTGTTSAVSEGQAVRFLADGQSNRVDLESVEVVEAEVQRAPKVPAVEATPSNTNRRAGYVHGRRGGNPASSTSRDDYWANKEKRDLEKDARYQTVDIPRMTFCTSQDAAIAFVCAAMAKDILPAAGSKKADKLDTILSYIDELTSRFFEQRMASKVSLEEGQSEYSPALDSDEGENNIE